ncbi:MAG: hypothetical protein A3H69_00295 [Candidatus Sungbacteria bacterium RIFCSPLOWO2_02_FULL_47_9]|uniref:Uncharacterized protein n=1 Tax=Candidatus Sungbacteria bacterium RIFCSPHIGHO2_01_FULL_47_32 TaxID=1802264 RepID=A0A1G2K6Q3_9BACT|nr:MAG: hypothetical protein UX72_C0012G0012 [Parcubacteria group bacterium GW2011_GWA2_47_10]OGZ94170.1 MAG: hypothetical protein A2633_02890 [Candidatus Sungbacteria bacterium RIFCSPHIGHO2_01_FULL_47_32]OHA00002.1 MAG: hypothetical protein A3D57_03695 [Candidatus Sungbacteria bacterium RIFCSPHIGHO2_02_FULL_46_12]OHA06266.1 MAG: hypothetical protein A3A28_02115 [Candidatus Sungbacteria bacterium RIFCSPLOWO2_01_FULL_47_32]OHA09773.1 MAG: hypothetical protein A3H69_00295 [Candidatus Sungbacteria
MRVFEIFSSIFLIVLFLVITSAPSFAETRVDKPALPEAYEAWPYTYKAVCYTDTDGIQATVSMFARAGVSLKSTEVIQVFSTTEQYYIHSMFSSAESGFLLATFDYLYQPNNGGWNKFDMLNEDEERTQLILENLNMVITVMCPRVHKEVSAFWTKALRGAVTQ